MTAQLKLQPETPPSYADQWEYLADELQHLDLLIEWQVAAFRAQTQPFQRLAADRRVFIAHEEVDWLLGNKPPPSHEPSAVELATEVGRNKPALAGVSGKPTGGGMPETVVARPYSGLHINRNSTALNPEPREIDKFRLRVELSRNTIKAKLAASLTQGIALPLQQLARVFGLSPLEVQIVVICLAPELQRKYDRLYAYLQDDITRKKPSIDLVLMLLCPTETERWQARAYFFAQSPLFQAGIVHMLDDPQNPSGSSDLAKFLRLDVRILHYLLGHQQIDGRLAGLATVYHPSSGLEQVLVESTAKNQMEQVLQQHFTQPLGMQRKVAVYCHGPQGVGKLELALGACAQLACPLIHLELDLLLARETEMEALLRLAFREGLLLQSAIYLDSLQSLLNEEPKSKVALKVLSKLMADYGWLVFLSGEKPWNPESLFGTMAFHAIALPLPEVPLREAAWRDALMHCFPDADQGWADQLAKQFRLTPGQIRTAATRAEALRTPDNGQVSIDLADLYAACRNQSNQKLGEVAVKVELRSGWLDIVLPQDKVNQLQEICSQARHRYQVFSEWGFDRKLSHGKGLGVLFTGSSGTGKTMAAEVIAGELRVDLYKVDLSSVVSKYIGETEKNLSRIFFEAESSNAILFFDEADALFGKRTDVSDAHDRYANIETSYLLQKMEEYAGIVMLATNLRENMDDAFTRRLRFIVEFPFPDESSRALIWKTHFPPEAPLSGDIDYQVLARKFPIAGGNIKNIVLNAAFYAAESGTAIGMEHILRGMRREFEKLGKSWNEGVQSIPTIRKA